MKAVGFGALAGMLALIVASIGFISKLFAEAIEEISLKQVEAVRATGAAFLNVLVMGVLPQVLPRFIGFATYQLDSNLRNSTMVGIVGGGGIGATLFTAFQRFDYDFVLAILLVIIALIMVGEIVSGWMRQRVPVSVAGPRSTATWRRFTPGAAPGALAFYCRDRRRRGAVAAHDRDHPGVPLRRAGSRSATCSRACGRSTGR